MADVGKSFLEQIQNTINENGDLLYWISTIFVGALMMNSRDENSPEFVHTFGIIIFIVGLTFSFHMLLKKTNYEMKLSHTHVITYLLLIPALIYELINTSFNSVSFTLSLIIILFSARYLLYKFYLWSWRKQKGKPHEKKWNASAITYFILFLFLITFGKTIYYNIILLFLVYAIYDFTKVKYLTPSIKKDGDATQKTNIFTEILQIDFFAWIIVLFLFMLYNYNVFNIEKQTLYYFYSTISQVFSALLGIVVMFGILILQQEKNNECLIKNIFLKKGLIGFTIIYIFVIMLSLSGILITNDIVQENAFESLETVSSENIRNFVNMTIFELSFLMTPVALLYLYALVSNILKLEPKENDEYQKKLADY